MIKTISKVIFLILLIVSISLVSKKIGVLAATPTGNETEKLIQAELSLAKEKETEILVQYKPGLRDKRSLFSTDSSLLVKQTVNVGPDILIVSPQNGVESSRLIEEIRKDNSVIHIESNIKHKLHTVPNDPGYANQWGMKTIMAEEAWADMGPSKKSVIVAVIDSGLELSHSDLQDKVAPGGHNFILGSDNIYDVNGHGTSVSGVIAAKTNNGLGIAGVVGTVDVRILPLQVANHAGESYTSDVISAIDYAISKGADVINLSLGSNSYSELENEAVQRAIQAGVIVVASAGNDGNHSYTYPASYDNVISVGSIDKTGIISDFSNINDQVAVVAPGDDIYSCGLNNSYSNHSGTSFSAPMVAGIAAVLRAIKPSMQPDEVKRVLETSAQDKGNIGRDNYYGYGVANMDDAVKQVSYIPVDRISLEPTDLQLSLGGTKTLTAGFIPLNASQKTLSWVSDNPAVANIDGNGLVTAVGIGQALIIAISGDGGKTATCNVSVIDAKVTLQSITITSLPSKSSYTVGDALDITGLVVTGTYYDGSTKVEPIAAANVTGFNSAVAVANQVLTITVSGQIVTYTVQVVAAPLKGDINGDGTVNILDVVQAVNYALGKTTPTTTQLNVADMNGDGGINILDVVQMVNKSLGR